MNRELLLRREWINQLQKLKNLKLSLKEIDYINSLEVSHKTKLDWLLQNMQV